MFLSYHLTERKHLPLVLVFAFRVYIIHVNDNEKRHPYIYLHSSYNTFLPVLQHFLQHNFLKPLSVTKTVNHNRDESHNEYGE